MAACASGSLEPSHVLLAMGVAPELGGGSIRISLGFDSREPDVQKLLAVLPGAVERVRRERRDAVASEVGAGSKFAVTVSTGSLDNVRLIQRVPEVEAKPPAPETDPV